MDSGPLSLEPGAEEFAGGAMTGEPIPMADAVNLKLLSYASVRLPGCRCALCESRRSAQLVRMLRSKFAPSTVFTAWKSS